MGGPRVPPYTAGFAPYMADIARCAAPYGLPTPDPELACVCACCACAALGFRLLAERGVAPCCDVADLLDDWR